MEEDRIRLAEHMRLRLVAIRKEKDGVLQRLRELEAREEHLAKVFRSAFPGLKFEPPAAGWDDLTDTERVTVHFIAKRGHIRRVADLLPAYRVETADDVTETGFRMRLTRLRQKGALRRDYNGWSVVDELFAVALHPPTTPTLPREDAEVGFEKLAARMRAARSNARKATFRGRLQRDGECGVG